MTHHGRYRQAPRESSVTTDELTVLVLCDHTFKVEYVVGAFTYFCCVKRFDHFILSTFSEFDFSIKKISSAIFIRGELILCNF